MLKLLLKGSYSKFHKPPEVEGDYPDTGGGTRPPFPAEKGVNFMDERFYILTLLIENIEDAYLRVNKILHEYADYIHLRVGYPVKEENIGIIFLVVKANNDVIGALAGKLGQINHVCVKSMALKR